MKPIQTSYKGYRFRSRTEARWAVFFETIGFRWEYEPQGYVLSNGTCYLPDFKLVFPGDRIVYCEVKSEEFDDFSREELGKLRMLADGVSCNVILLTGSPSHRVYQQIVPNTPPNVLTHVFFQDYAPYVQITNEYWLQSLSFDENTGRMHFTMDERRLAKAFGRGYIEAVNTARSARFEHGEAPKSRTAKCDSEAVDEDQLNTQIQNPQCYKCGREITGIDVAVFPKDPNHPIKRDAPKRSYGLVNGTMTFSFCVNCAKNVPCLQGVWQVNA